jgi:hypothetical protein
VDASNFLPGDMSGLDDTIIARRQGLRTLTRGIGVPPALQNGSDVFAENRMVARATQPRYFGLEFGAKFDF